MLAERLAPTQLAELAMAGARLESAVRPGDWPRLAAVAARGSLAVAVQLGRSADALPLVGIRVDGAVELTCQRCLQPLEWPVAVDVTLTAVPGEERLGELADPFDSVLLEADGGLQLRAAVEDEVLAVLPLAPLHAARQGAAAADAEPRDGPDGRHRTRPFAGLADLMARRDRQGRQD
jgi:uncharacterized protein